MVIPVDIWYGSTRFIRPFFISRLPVVTVGYLSEFGAGSFSYPGYQLWLHFGYLSEFGAGSFSTLVRKSLASGKSKYAGLFIKKKKKCGRTRAKMFFSSSKSKRISGQTQDAVSGYRVAGHPAGRIFAESITDASPRFGQISAYFFPPCL